VVEITDQLDLSGWPVGSRVIVRRERAPPGAQLSVTDLDGHRFQAVLTDQVGDIADFERRRRAPVQGSRTTSAATGTPARAACPSATSSTTASGLTWCASPTTCSPRPDDCSWTANSLAASPSACATDSFMLPAASPSTPAPQRCASRPPGPWATELAGAFGRQALPAPAG
jgi:hypothetical protein